MPLTVIRNYSKLIKVSAEPPSKWNAFAKNPNLTLSNGDLTATKSQGVAAWNTARGNNPRTSGRFYIEMTSTSNTGATGTEPQGFGILNATQDVVPDNNYIGVSTDSIGFYPNNGFVYTNGASDGIATLTAGGGPAGRIWGVGIDLDNKVIIINGANHTSYNKIPMNLALVNAGSFFPGLTLSRVGAALTVNFGASAFSATVPVEYAAGWDAVTPVVPCQWSKIANNQVTVSGTRNEVATTFGDPNSTHHQCSATTFKNSGKWYYEILLNQGISANRMAMGISSPDKSFIENPGATGRSFFYYNGGANNGGPDIFTSANGDTICCATDFDNKRIWFRKNAGVWNAGGGADPATNVGGFDLTSILTAGYVFAPRMSGYDGTGTHVQVTANFGRTSFAQSIPSGFSGWAELGS